MEVRINKNNDQLQENASIFYRILPTKLSENLWTSVDTLLDIGRKGLNEKPSKEIISVMTDFATEM